MGERFYDIAKRGLATNFTETEIPVDYALRFRNRFINAAGGAEKRPGYVALPADIPTKGTVTGIHEYVDGDGNETLFCSADGAIFRYNGSSAYTQVYAFTTAARVRSIQFSNKLVFWNGYDRQVSIDSVTADFQRLDAVMEQGFCGAATSAAALTDADISDWTAQTFVTVGDIVFNAKRGAYGIVTAVTSARVSHTTISANAQGFGNTTTPVSGGGIGGEPVAGDGYKIFDSIELNIVESDGIKDNVAIVTSAVATASGTYVSVSADRVSNWLKTEIRPLDIVHNTTRDAGSFVHRVVSSGIFLSPAISTMAAGDTIVLYKSAMPLASYIHVHFGRAWMVDGRNKRLIVASGEDDIEDFTVDSETLESRTVDMGSQQDGADVVKALESFQNYLIVGTERAIFAYRGTSPTDLAPAGLFPQGLVGPDAFVNTGNDVSFVGYDGLLSISLLLNTNNLQRANLSEPIKNTLRGIIREVVAANPNEPDIQVINYQRRSWVVMKIASKIYIYNYANFLSDDGRLLAGASWSDFDGQIGLQRTMAVRANSDLALGGAGGKVYLFDQDTYTDAGVTYPTEYMTGWLTLEEPRKTSRVKIGSFIIPNYQVSGEVVYTIEATGDFDMLSLDSVSVTAREDIGGRPVGVYTIGSVPIGTAQTMGQKTPLRWRGKSFRLSFRTQDSAGPDVLAGFSVYAEILGRR
jgi:hypothetical protein